MPVAPPSGYLVVVGASAGGITALQELAAGLPATFPAPVCVVQHVGTNISILPELLARSGPLPAVHAGDQQRLEAGTIYVAPPDHHMLVEDGRLRLTRGPRENHTRPAIDPLFRTAALHWGPHAIGVVLTGFLDDGTAGLAAIKSRGGTAVVEDPATAYEASMPRSALAHVSVDHCVPVSQVGPLLAKLVHAPAEADAPPAEALRVEVAIDLGDTSLDRLATIATPSALTCPDCGGALFELKDRRPLRYRCHTGHAFSARALESAQVEEGEHALRSGVRALRERVILLRRMAAAARGTGDERQADAALLHAERLQQQIAQLRRLAEGVEGPEELDPPPP